MLLTTKGSNMNNKVKTIWPLASLYFMILVLLFGSLEMAAAKEKQGSSVQGAANAAHIMVDDLEAMSKDMNTKLKFLKNDDVYTGPAYRIFKSSLSAIQVIFKDEVENKEEKLLSATKQIACIFVAETHYGNLTGAAAYDECDRTNIAQIRPPSYKSLFEKCSNDEKIRDLYSSMFGPNMSCDNFHPYELPPCNNTQFPQISSYDRSQKQKDNFEPEDAFLTDYLSPAKRLVDARTELMSLQNKKGRGKKAISLKPHYPRKNEDSAMSCVEQKRLEYLDQSFQSIFPAICTNTKNVTSLQLPAIENHSIFAGILYLKIQGFNTKKSDAAFPNCGAEFYNGANASEKAIYQQKLVRCLAIFNEPENKAIIKTALKNVISSKE
jgi:hypothetical protein